MAQRDKFTEAFGATVADVRQKLVEEGWFGRAVTPRPGQGRDRMEDGRSLAEQFGWGRGKDAVDPAPDHGIGR